MQEEAHAGKSEQRRDERTKELDNVITYMVASPSWAFATREQFFSECCICVRMSMRRSAADARDLGQAMVALCGPTRDNDTTLGHCWERRRLW